MLRLFLPLTILLPSAALAADEIDFKKDIVPILRSRCYECHSESKKKEKGGYVFDNVDRFKTEIGPSFLVRPGDASGSEFLLKMTSTGRDRMPPAGNDPVSPKELEKIRKWIDQGAKIDDGKSSKTAQNSASNLPAKPVASKNEVLTWTNTKGVAIKAQFVSMTPEKVTLKLSNGKVVPVNMADLSKESQAQARKAAIAPEK